MDTPTEKHKTAISSDQSPSRRLAPGAPVKLVQALVQSMVGAELVSPGEEFWIALQRLWNVPLLDNRANSFRHLEPNWPQARVRMITVLEKLVKEGVQVRIITEAHRSNQTFADEFRALPHGSEDPSLCTVEDWGRTIGGIVGSSFYLEGGLQCSRASGLTVTGRELLVFADEDVVQQGRQRLSEMWQMS